MGFGKKIFGFCKKTGKEIALILALAHGATQINYTANDFVNYDNPSQMRRDFQKQFDFPIKGFEEDIEEQPKDIMGIAEVVQREKQTKNFQLRNMRIESNNYLKRSLAEQFGDIFTIGYSGWYFGEKIGITKKAGQKTLTHEIKHAKTFDIIRDHPEFLDKWKALAKDENGNSLYRGDVVTACKRVRGLEKLFRDLPRPVNYEKSGFVSNYARSNVYEDIAETCEMAELDPCIETYLFGVSPNPHNNAIPKNEKVVAKIKLAEEYGLIPPGFMEYSELKRLFPKALGAVENGSGTKTAEEFLEKSRAFLDKHPNSVYECELRVNRGYLLESKTVAQACSKNKQLEWAHKYRESVRGSPSTTLEECNNARNKEKEILKQNRNLTDHLDIAVFEYEKALKAGFKQGMDYSNALCALQRCYEILGDEKKAKTIQDATYEYSRRVNNSDLRLFATGVNDYLESNGSLDTHESRQIDFIGGNK
ncbi:Uncharacterised protein [uncultured archaeon]|nr:Uncharacterised protein [uncultured archaeon]